MWKIVLAVVVLAIVFPFLYRKGYIITQAKSALLFVSSLNGKKARFSRCSGYIKRPVRFSESGSYRFFFSLQLTEGKVWAELVERKGQPLFTLSQAHPQGDFLAEQGGMYFLKIRFEKASGNYQIRWEKNP